MHTVREKSVYHVVKFALHLDVFELGEYLYILCSGCTVKGSLCLLWNETCFSENLPPGRGQERVRLTCSIITNLFSTNLKIEFINQGLVLLGYFPRSKLNALKTLLILLN